ncbi:cysteine methyltransferase [Bacillus sp. UMB0899]|uniref:methylated-DNA--[protein]-cysteine S-methyltransferase n=1 Tax=Metabacillus schmidteae TaxID=2730405 RepID=UPI000C8107FB|nr:methylated-DNA--[protein]-cysteine S-methyltransferase [Metabacillus schmidteae]PMC35266.1 cysteine methyltransferase [Bacillus sp. UMB0899]
MYYYRLYESPLGTLTIVSKQDKITNLFLTTEQFESFKSGTDVVSDQTQKCEVLQIAIQQLHEYFHENRKEFHFPMELNGTDFQKKIWKKLREIPFGKVWSYQDVAMAIGQKNAVRAIGQANKANKLPIFIPCHRVIGKNKKLTGYAGTKTELKATLLTHEKIPFKE